MWNPFDWLVVWRLKRKMRSHGYSEVVITAVITMYTKPKLYETI